MMKSTKNKKDGRQTENNILRFVNVFDEIISKLISRCIAFHLKNAVMKTDTKNGYIGKEKKNQYPHAAKKKHRFFHNQIKWQRLIENSS